MLGSDASVHVAVGIGVKPDRLLAVDAKKVHIA